MKKLLIGAVAAGLFVTGSIAASGNYNQYQTKQRQEAAKAAAQAAETQKKATAQTQLVVETTKAKYNLLLAECVKGVNAYAKLPAFTKTTLQAPNCGTALQ